MKLKLELEYTGEPFSGWQSQEGQLTVQGDLERALNIYFTSQAKKLGVELSGQPVAITGSGRTDAGVNAKGQIASFQWPEQIPYDPKQFLKSVNGITVPQLIILRATEMDDSFDARRTPHFKCYSYHMLLRDQFDGVYAGRTWGVGHELNVPAMIRAARVYVGTHDFSSFRARDCNAKTTTRTIMLSELSRLSRDELVFIVHGNGFLKQMIRIMVGTLVDIGSGKLAAEDLAGILAAKDRTRAGMTAPAAGLTLEWVKYGEKPYY